MSGNGRPMWIPDVVIHRVERNGSANVILEWDGWFPQIKCEIERYSTKIIHG